MKIRTFQGISPTLGDNVFVDDTALVLGDVRLGEDNQALLIDQTLNAANETRDWLERDIVDISEAEVVEVTITHPDGEQVVARKSSADEQDFTLQDLPEGREIHSAYSVNSLAGSLDGLQLDEVTTESSVDWSQLTKLRLLTADGLEVSVDLATAEEKEWLRLAASQHQQESAAVDERGSDDTESDDVEQLAVTELAQRVEEINHRVAGWAFVIPDHKSGNIKKRMEDLLKPPQED